MKKKFNIYLILLVVCSLLLGFPHPAINMEFILAFNIPRQNEGMANNIKAIVLIVTQLMVISLLFVKRSELYWYLLIIFPMAFLIADIVALFIIYLMVPLFFLFHIPYLIAYYHCLKEYKKLNLVGDY